MQEKIPNPEAKQNYSHTTAAYSPTPAIPVKNDWPQDTNPSAHTRDTTPCCNPYPHRCCLKAMSHPHRRQNESPSTHNNRDSNCYTPQHHRHKNPNNQQDKPTRNSQCNRSPQTPPHSRRPAHPCTSKPNAACASNKACAKKTTHSPTASYYSHCQKHTTTQEDSLNPGNQPHVHSTLQTQAYSNQCPTTYSHNNDPTPAATTCRIRRNAHYSQNNPATRP